MNKATEAIKSGELITSLIQNVKLYKQPKRIGEVMEFENKKYLVIGIQDITIHSARLQVRCICQLLGENYLYPPAKDITKDEHLIEFETTIKTGKKDVLEYIRLGKMFTHSDGYPYQTVMYTDVEVISTDVKVSFLARPIRPISHKEAKAILREEKKKELNLSLI